MAGDVSALFLLDIKGRVLIWRDFRGDVTAVQAERFFTKLIEKEGDPESHDPVVYDNGVSYMFIQHNNVYLMAASRQNCNAASLLFFLHRVVDVSAIGNLVRHFLVSESENEMASHDILVLSSLNDSLLGWHEIYTTSKL